MGIPKFLSGKILIIRNKISVNYHIAGGKEEKSFSKNKYLSNFYFLKQTYGTLTCRYYPHNDKSIYSETR